MPSHHPSDRTPLGIAQKMFIQRMLAEHCWTEAQAELVYQECGKDDDERHHDLPPRSSTPSSPSLVDLIKWCNSHLSDFGLEIVSVTLPDSYCYHPQEEEPERPHSRRSTSSAGTSGTSNSSKGSTSTKYYTMVNQFPDAITKDVYQNYLFQPPSLQSYVKRVLSHLAQSYPQPAARATLLNLKHSAVPPPHRPDDDQKDPTVSSQQQQQQQPKVTLTLAEDMLERLLDEQWLRPVHGDASPPSSSRGGGAGTKIGLGPRAWGELSYFLTTPTEEDANNNNDDDDARRRLWPQPIYIRY